MLDVLNRKGKILKMIKLRERVYLYYQDGKNNFLKLQIINQMDSFNHMHIRIFYLIKNTKGKKLITIRMRENVPNV